MKLLLVSVMLVAASRPVLAGEASKEQCDAVWRMVLSQGRQNSAYGQAILGVWGTLAEATKPSSSLKGSSLHAVVDLSGKVSTVLNTLRPIKDEIRVKSRPTTTPFSRPMSTPLKVGSA